MALSICALAAGAALLPTIALIAAALILERALAFGVSGGWVAGMLPFGAWAIMGNNAPWHDYNAIASGLAAGGALAAMLLGHSYLTARSLSFKPFRHMAGLLLGILIMRTFTVIPEWFPRDPPAPMMDLVFLSMRTAAGLLLPLVFAWMVWQCVKAKSNQSATGILYAMTVLVGGFGELIAVYLEVSPS